MLHNTSKDLLSLESGQCNFLTNAIAIKDIQGKIKPCCGFGTTDLSFKIPTVFDVDSLDEIFVSEVWQNIRKNLKTTNKSYHACSKCWNKESMNIDSLRMYAFEHSAQLKTIKKNKLQYLEIALDNTCNMMCRMCRPACSSKWLSAKDVTNKLQNLEHDHFLNNNLQAKRYSDKLNLVLDNTNFSDIETIHIVGGEPFYSKNFYKLLDKIGSQANLEKVKLSISTNGSILPKEYFSLFKKLRQLEIFFSIDAVGDLANCIRWGVDFSLIDKNINDWLTLKDNTKFISYTTLNIQNCNKVNDIINWNVNKNLSYTFNPLNRPKYLKLNQLPLHERKKFKIDKKILQKNTTLKNILYDNNLDTNNLKKFLESCEILDKHQGIQFEKVNPEIYNLAKKYAVY